MDLDLQKEALEKIKLTAKTSLYFLCKAVLGFDKFQPKLHGLMCKRAERTLASYREGKSLRSIELYPRGHYKTSVFSIGLPVWLYINENDIRILLAGSTATNASMRLTRIERIFESNQMFQLLFPELIPENTRKTKWSEAAMLLPRKKDFLESTIEAIGVGGKVTSRHYNIIITDDLVDETCLQANGLPSEIMIQAACQWHDYMDFLFDVPERGIELMPCTRWAEQDLVEHVREVDKRFEITTHSAIGGCCDWHPDGEPIFPLDEETGAGFTMEGLAEQRTKDPYKFALQELNNPISKDITDFSLGWLKYYQVDLKGNYLLETSAHTFRRVPRYRLNVYTTVDPAFRTKSRHDFTAIVTIGVSTPFSIVLLEARRVKAAPELVIDEILRANKTWRPQRIGIEAVAAQTILKSFLEHVARERGIQLNVEEIPGKLSNVSKEERIRALIYPFKSGQIFISRGMHEVIDELERFPFGKYKDILDALAYGVGMWRQPQEDLMDSTEDFRVERDLADRNAVTGY